MRKPALLLAALFAASITTSLRAEDWLYLTSPSDTLIGIGKQYLKNPNDWPKVQVVNAVGVPERLPANTRIKIPVALLKVTPAPVEVTHISGNVRLRNGSAPFRPLTVGDRLTGGETVQTGPNGFASYRLADGSTLRQQPTSRLVFGRLAAYGKTGMVATELSLENGRLEASAARQLAPAGGMQVRTPVAVAGLRGTNFRLNVSDDGQQLRGELLDGGLAIQRDREEVHLTGGKGLLAEAGKPLGAAQPLPAAPRVIALPAVVRSLPIHFAWQADPASRQWRAQISADEAFEKLQLDAQVNVPEVGWDTALPDGDYVFRLRAVNAAGLEGFNLDHKFRIDLRPPPPTNVVAVTTREEIELRWQGETARYRVELANVAGFDPDLLMLDSPNQSASLTKPEPGQYLLRVIAISADGDESLPSAIVPIEIKRAVPWWLWPLMLLPFGA